MNQFETKFNSPRNAILVSHSNKWGLPTCDVIGYYPKVSSKKELAYRLFCDTDLFEHESSLFYHLVLLNQNRIKQISQLAKLSDQINQGEHPKITMSQIIYLYTKLLPSKMILIDLELIAGSKTYQICFENQKCWKQIKHTYFSSCQGSSKGAQVKPEVDLASLIDRPLTAPRTKDMKEFDYDHQDQSGNPIHPPKRTKKEKKRLKHQLDLELEWIFDGKQEIDVSTPEGKKLLKMGWTPID